MVSFRFSSPVKVLTSAFLAVSLLSSPAARADDRNDDNPPVNYLEFTPAYTISKSSPLTLFLDSLQESLSVKESATDSDPQPEPDPICSCEYLTLCAKQCALDEYGTFPLAKSASELKRYLTEENNFPLLGSEDPAEEGDVVFYASSPGVVLEDSKVLFVDEDGEPFTTPLSDLEDCQIIRVKYPYYENLAYLYMKEKLHYSPECAVGIMANLQCESEFQPAREETSNQMGFGICQWSKERRLDLKYYCAKEGKNICSIFTQLDFLHYELTHEVDLVNLYYNLTRQLSADEDGAYIAAYLFCQIFENPYDADNAAVDRGVLAMTTYYPVYGGA